MSVDTSDLVKFSDEMNDLHTEIFDRQLPKAGLTYGIQVKNLARRLVPVDTGALKLSITERVTKGSRGIMVEVGPTQRYGPGIEFGRPPHHVSPQALSGWAKRKGLNPYAVAHGIAKKGTKAQPYMLPAFEGTSSFQEKFVTTAIAEALRVVFNR